MIEPTLRQLEYFTAVAEELHFTRAAARLGIAQPPLTQQIRKLEALLGCALFTRGRTTSLTAAGATLLEESGRILAQMERAIEVTRETARGNTGRLAVGVPPSVMLSSLPGVVRRYRERYPEVAFTLREMSTSAIEDAVRTGEIDLGFLRETKPPKPLLWEAVYTEPVVAVLPERHKTNKGPFQLESLRSEPFVLFPRKLGPELHDRLTSECVRAGFAPNIAAEATQWQTVISLVEAGMGVSLAPGCVRKFRWGRVTFKPVAGAKTAVTVCWHEKGLTPTAESFLKMVRRACATINA
jgi:DNA-binding transcriptional LysR family regulator